MSGRTSLSVVLKLIAAALLVLAACAPTATPGAPPMGTSMMATPMGAGVMATPMGTAMMPPGATSMMTGTVAPGGSVTITSPADGATVSGPVTITVKVAGIKLDGTKIGTEPAPGIGHYHLQVDGKYAGLAVSGAIMLPNDAMPTISKGKHAVSVQLHQNDHKPVDGAQPAQITLNFDQDVSLSKPQANTPAIQILSPANDARVKLPFTVVIQWSGITFDGTKIGGPPVQGIGHWHLTIDGKYAGLSVTGVIEVPNDAMPALAPGQHTLTVELHENDHKPLTPPVTQTITMTVQ